MTLKEDMAKAKKARQKLVSYAGGLPKGAGTDKFDELNAEADKAIRKLPKYLQNRLAEDFIW